MLSTIPTLLVLLIPTLAVAAPTAHNEHPRPNKEAYKQACNEDWDNKWRNDEWKKSEKIFYFDAEYIVKATPDQVIATDGKPTPGQPGAKGIFKYGINVAENTICYVSPVRFSIHHTTRLTRSQNITLSGVTGAYRSPAITATHIHEAIKGKAGPPRLAFPNPKGPDGRRVSYGCLTGPFFVGVNSTTGTDQAAGFHVKQIVDNPSGFFTDSHTVDFTAGALRGQLA